jgi:uncharacterized protein YecE (DUF72 family)
MLRFYTEHFDAVELNSTFYKLASPGAAADWSAQTPRGFLFTAKGSRFITHMKKLRDAALAVSRYFERLQPLGRKLGPIVFQLPPHWAVSPDRLADFLDVLPRGHRYAFEFRDPSWHVPEVYALLRRHRAAFCIYDLAGFQSPLEITSDFTYVRLHGPGAKYQGRYEEPQLREWAGRLRQWNLKSSYVFFDNDQAAYAAWNAKLLRDLVGSG